MSFTLANGAAALTPVLANGHRIDPGKSVAVDAVAEDSLVHIAASRITLTLAAAASTRNALVSSPIVTNTTGTPVAVASLAVTLGAISDTATAANAIATLGTVINLITADLRRAFDAIASLQTQLMQNSIIEA